MGDKEKTVARHKLNPPESVALAEHFAFCSLLPLDECARNLVHFWWMRSSVYNTGMNDQHFVVANPETSGVCGWVIGTLRDMDGETTLVEGQMGIAPIDFGRMCVQLPLGAVIFPMIFGWPGVALAIVQAIWVTLGTRYTKARMRRHVREVFGLEGDGLLPMVYRVEE